MNYSLLTEHTSSIWKFIYMAFQELLESIRRGTYNQECIKLSQDRAIITDAHIQELVEAIIHSKIKITELDLRECEQITDAGVVHIKSLTCLTHLNLGYCKHITDDGIAHLESLTALTRLNLAGAH